MRLIVMTFAAWLAALAATIALGGLIAGMSHGSAHRPEMVAAAITCSLATALAMVPLILSVRASQMTVVSMGLAATALHLFACVAFSMLLVFGSLVRSPRPFMFWTLGFYWTTLIVVASAAIGRVKSASASPLGTQAPAAGQP